ncbi:hypothetical protein POM88_029768 [Heracleum sosnowskyi]|uniref:Uncharacterized protein n=1 Tax=Heracleum sosnowskyi TaxID=360622 RepID=A0AAD8MF55_9APIA|nr:hypothetical protein POM88_029768 [Heracleum sosnowskyi]
MGVMAVVLALPMALVHFPQWGSMFLPASKNNEHSEEHYYRSKWTEDEKEKDFHNGTVTQGRTKGHVRISHEGRFGASKDVGDDEGFPLNKDSFRILVPPLFLQIHASTSGLLLGVEELNLSVYWLR